MSNSSRGIQRERAVQDLMQAEGWVVARCAGSKGEYDLMAMRAGSRNRLTEVKSTTAGPFCDFGPADRAELSAAAAQAGAEAWLCWWPKRKAPKWYSESSWPKRQEGKAA
jgi:Holliday junction resolvase